MESDLKIDNIKIQASSELNTGGGSESSEQRIAELETALKVVKEKFENYGGKLRGQIIIWSLICILLILCCIILSIFLINEKFPEIWSWQIAYVSIIRITIATAIFTIATFCFRNFQSYIHLKEQNNHNLTVIESMANLVGAGKDESQRNLIYGKLIDIIINLDKSGFVDKNTEIKGVSSYGFDLINKVIESKKT